jgi:hypothetical protein
MGLITDHYAADRFVPQPHFLPASALVTSGAGVSVGHDMSAALAHVEATFLIFSCFLRCSLALCPTILLAAADPAATSGGCDTCQAINAVLVRTVDVVCCSIA